MLLLIIFCFKNTKMVSCMGGQTSGKKKNNKVPSLVATGIEF